jgi:hypothetical protein
MRFNRIQVAIGLMSSSILLFLTLCPPWEQASQKMPPQYRKELGRGFLWSAPKTVPDGCYFTYMECIETPASDFYPVVNRQLVLMQSIPLAMVTFLLWWLTRTDDGERSRTGYSTTTRVTISLSLALVVPAFGGIPTVILLFLLLGSILDQGETTWLYANQTTIYAVGLLVFVVAIALTIFGLLSGIQLLTRRKSSIRGV